MILLFFTIRLSWEQKTKASAPMMVELWENLPPAEKKPHVIKPVSKPAPTPPLPPKADIALKKEEAPKKTEKPIESPQQKEEPKKIVKETPKVKKEVPKKTVDAPPKKDERKPTIKKEPVKVVKQEPPKKEAPKLTPKQEVPKKETPAKPQEVEATVTPKTADRDAQAGRSTTPSFATLPGASAGTSLQGAAFNGYIQKIQIKIYRYMNTNACGNSNWQATASVRLMPGGTLLGPPSIIQSSGIAACDRAIIAAIMQSEPLPVPEDLMLFNQFRTLNLKFRPQ